MEVQRVILLFALAFILLPMVVFLGEQGNELIFEIVQVVAWPVHVALAEWLMRRPRRRNPALPYYPAAV